MDPPPESRAQSRISQTSSPESSTVLKKAASSFEGSTRPSFDDSATLPHPGRTLNEFCLPHLHSKWKIVELRTRWSIMEHDYDDDALDSPHPIPQSINILFSYSMTQRNLKIVPCESLILTCRIVSETTFFLAPSIEHN